MDPLGYTGRLIGTRWFTTNPSIISPKKPLVNNKEFQFLQWFIPPTTLVYSGIGLAYIGL